MKKTVQILLAGIFVCFTGCKFEEENIFDDSSANRLEKAKIEYAGLLCSSPNGWVMEYFPTDDQTGYTFLMKFLENGEVKMLSKSALTGNKLTRDSCLFEFTSISGPVLTFNSYSENNTFHQLSTPEDISGTDGSEQGYGYGGDYEFTVMKTGTNHILLKGLKRKVYIPLTRLPEERNWEDYFNLLDEMNTTLFGANTPQLRLTVNDSSFTLTGGASHIFKITPESGDPVTDGIDRSFIITDYGIRFAKPFETNDLSVQTFQLSEDKGSLICTDENVNAKIEGPDVVQFFNERADNGGRWSLATGENTMSGQVKAIYDRAVKSFSDKNITLSQIAYIYSGRYSTQSILITVNKNTTGVLFFDKEATQEGVNYTFKNNYDSNGKVFYTNYDGVKELIDNVLSGTFRIEPVGSKLSPSSIKFIHTGNPDIWFVVEI
ncbi:MAG: DUF4302 domain-containing protein [Dysgonamonadaceae bacterium]|jgi:hypothetical protein|nr:DUF4302 domain-containing protein [Dysgonamonadaceae bacterium]